MQNNASVSLIISSLNGARVTAIYDRTPYPMTFSRCHENCTEKIRKKDRKEQEQKKDIP